MKNSFSRGRTTWLWILGVGIVTTVIGVACTSSDDSTGVACDSTPAVACGDGTKGLTASNCEVNDTSGNCISMYFKVSDGTQIDCASCSKADQDDCHARLANYCSVDEDASACATLGGSCVTFGPGGSCPDASLTNGQSNGCSGAAVCCLPASVIADGG